MRLKKRNAPRLLICIICIGLAMSMFHSAKAQDITLSPNLPFDVPLNSHQGNFDTFSWQSFVALNWPALSNGTPDTSTMIGDPNATPVWQFYYDPADVFLPGGAQPPDPADYPIAQTIPPACQSSTVNVGAGQQQRIKVIRQFTKKGDVEELPRGFLEATGQPVVDQVGNYVVYEVRINPDEYNYIFENQLYDASIQKNATINFPEGNISSQVAGVGAMEIKAAWRVFPPNISAGIMARYFTMPGLIFIPAQFSATGADLCLNATWGLVGMHIIHKTSTQPQWIWSTFEQIDNVPGENGNAVSPTFNNPNDLQPVCPNIEAPEPQYLWQANQPHAVNQNAVPQPSTQVVRCTPIQASAALNQAWQSALKAANPASPWQYYQLVSTQWTGNGGDIVQPTLANTVLETYLQQSTFSCINCHSTAMTATGNQLADFSFMLSLAQSPPGTQSPPGRGMFGIPVKRYHKR